MTNGEKIVFLGDSLTEGGDWQAWFPDDEVVNLGVGGDTTADVLERLDEVVQTAPDSIVLLIGTNDFGSRRSVEQVVRNVESILVDLRRLLPGVRLLLQSIMPRGSDYGDRIQDANRHLRQFAATVRAQYLDLWPALSVDGHLNPDLSDDGLHLTAAGYEAWLGELRPGLERLRDEPPMSRPISIIRLPEPR
ncbi:N-acylneuraminate cytidylyltransferase [Frondihabitans sp. 762G35]|uniref:GDSL-type esterase/lipase family protein n=1 Tax=Frondihabitans sp. 762G35 TaxID=1446794 RepID=UPI000D2290C8|nr:GDSL-type esterase/lipase family protein [Frondihabitans sp. 762G35]ARC57151.1 N-acylneuraminate cytidylyltransferase [Frondihabitans sp. 762G35]